MLRVRAHIAAIALLVSAAGARAADIPGAIPSNLYLLAVNVTDSEGHPIAGAEVALDGIPLGLTDVTGQYYLARKPMAPGPHSLGLNCAGFARVSRSIVLPGGDAPGITVTVQLEKESQKAPMAAARRGGQQLQPNYNRVQVFYVTDRRDTGNADPRLRYADERAVGGAVSKGTCDVSIPRSHEAGSLESPSWVHLEFRPDPNKHVVLLNVNPLASDPFYRQLSERVAGSRKKEVVVFVHGFNNGFEEAARKTAQLTWDLKFDGAPILYSWPSRNSLLKYTEDEDTVQWTAFHLRAFLDELAQRIEPGKIHLIAHSMGNRALTSALQILAAKRPVGSKPLFDQVVLAAPDIGAETMDLLAGEVLPVAKRFTLYASDSDDALILSKFVHGGLRAGGKGKYLLIVRGIDTVDASAARTDFMGHAYFDNSVDIIADIQRMFASAAPPEARRLIPALLGNLRYWIIPAAATEGRTP